jgi:hypothetical protein
MTDKVCGHSACSQNYIDTGSRACVEPKARTRKRRYTAQPCDADGVRTWDVWDAFKQRVVAQCILSRTLARREADEYETAWLVVQALAALADRTWWDIHEASAPHESERWAITDRGWLFHGCGTALGHYLDYGPDWNGEDRSPDGNVHAVSISHTRHENGCTTATREARHFRTCVQARAWLESEAEAQGFGRKGG